MQVLFQQNGFAGLVVTETHLEAAAADSLSKGLGAGFAGKMAAVLAVAVFLLGIIAVGDLDPAAVLSSSFPSTFGHRTVRHRLSFNPYAGPAWGHSSAVASEDDRRSLLRSDIDDARDVPTNVRDLGADTIRPEYVFPDSSWDIAPTTGAYEISKGRRIGEFQLSVSPSLYYH